MNSLLDTLIMKESGRKFRAFLICMVAGTGAFVLSAVYPALIPVLAVYLTALGGFLVAYMGGNIAHHHVTMKNGGTDSSEEVFTNDVSE